MRTIAINRSDGKVSVMRIIDDSLEIPELISAWENAQRNSGNSLTCVSWHEITESDVPSDRTSRENWTWQ